jgi:cytidylate kinase
MGFESVPAIKKRSVAIDGPSGAGKSTISRAVAKKLGLIYIDTGALYRVIGLRLLERGGMELDTLKLSLKFVDGEQRVFDGGRDVTEDIRRHEVSKAASDCSAIPEVRAFLLELQRGLAAQNDVIMDGRDIGTVVLPNADLKIFLTAAPEDRAKRRFDELSAKGSDLSYEQILADIKARDHNDSTRKEAPLRQAEDAVLLDTTGNEFEQSAALIEGLIRERFDVL